MKAQQTEKKKQINCKWNVNSVDRNIHIHTHGNKLSTQKYFHRYILTFTTHSYTYASSRQTHIHTTLNSEFLSQYETQ